MHGFAQGARAFAVDDPHRVEPASSASSRYFSSVSSASSTVIPRRCTSGEMWPRLAAVSAPRVLREPVPASTLPASAPALALARLDKNELRLGHDHAQAADEHRPLAGRVGPALQPARLVDGLHQHLVARLQRPAGGGGRRRPGVRPRPPRAAFPARPGAGSDGRGQSGPPRRRLRPGAALVRR